MLKLDPVSQNDLTPSELKPSTFNLASTADEEEKSNQLGTSILKNSRYNANAISKQLFDSCALLPFLDTPTPSTLLPKPDSPKKQPYREMDFFRLTRKIEQTPPPNLSLASPEKSKLTQKLNDSEFLKRQRTCAKGIAVSKLLTDPYQPLVSCESLTRGMSEQQKQALHKFTRRTHAKVDMRVAMSVPATIGASTRTLGEFGADALTWAKTKIFSLDPTDSQLTSQVKLQVLMRSKGKPTFTLPDELVNPYYEFVDQVAKKNAAEFDIDPQDTEDFFSGLVTISTRFNPRVSLVQLGNISPKLPLIPLHILDGFFHKTEETVDPINEVDL